MTGTAVVKQDDSIYARFDREDETQIINSEKYLTSGKWLYEVQGQYAISYDGIRAFASWLAHHGLVVQTISSDITPSGEGEDLKYTAKVRVKEAGTGVIFEGISVQPQYGTYKNGSRYYDSTAETKAHSKAERNAIRKHVPANLIARFVDEVKKTGEVKTLSGEDTQAAQPKKPQGKPTQQKLGGSKDLCSCRTPDPKAVDVDGELIAQCKACGLRIKPGGGK